MPYTTARLLRGFTEVSDLFEFIGDDAIICGGWARWCASTHKKPKLASDVDVYCKSEESFNKLRDAFAATGKMPVYAEKPVAITYDKAQTMFPGCPRIQLIKPMVQGRVVTMGTASEILDNFDFSVVRACLLSPKEVLVDEHFAEDEENGVLRINNIHCPISTMYRVIKYIDKGYWIRPMEMVKLFVDWEERPEEYRTQLVAIFGDIAGGKEMSKEDIDELEALLHID